MVLEWVPSAAALAELPRSKTELTVSQQERLRKALSLLDADSSGSFSRTELREALREAEDLQLADSEINDLLIEHAQPNRDDPRCIRDALSFDELSDVLTSGRLRKEQSGRYFVLLSLAEAETIRCIMHMRQGKPLIPGADTTIALRCIPAHDTIFDVSGGHAAPQPYQQAVSHNCFRFIDSSMHFKPAELNILLRSIPELPTRRRIFFSAVVACRRRLKKAWSNTPLAKLFTLEDEWSMLKQRAQASALREGIKGRGWRLYDAFHRFDANDDGLLSFAEVYGALNHLQIRATPQDIIDFVSNVSSGEHITCAGQISCPDSCTHAHWRAWPPSCATAAAPTPLRLASTSVSHSPALPLATLHTPRGAVSVANGAW